MQGWVGFLGVARAGISCFQEHQLRDPEPVYNTSESLPSGAEARNISFSVRKDIGNSQIAAFAVQRHIVVQLSLRKGLDA